MSALESIPLLELCWRQLVPRGSGYAVKAGGEDALFEGLLAQREDPGLARGVHALFEAACLLHDEDGSPDAAAAILRALERARPHLPLRDQVQDAIQAASARGLDHVERRAPKLGAAAPEGSLKAHRFGNPGRTRG